jgi:hypothetical protein
MCRNVRMFYLQTCTVRNSFKSPQDKRENIYLNQGKKVTINGNMEIYVYCFLIIQISLKDT